MAKFNSKSDLRNYLIEANEAYRSGNAIISDGEYDVLEDQLRQLDPNDPFLNQVDDKDFGIEKALTIHMGSQQKALNMDEMGSFINNTQGYLLNVSEKLDGMSMELTYRSGIFTQALSRGDGEVGVDVTAIIGQVPNVPAKIDTEGTWVVRGEVMLAKSQLVALNEEMVADGKEPYTNTRNGTVGLAKTLKNRKYSKYLMFKAFDIQQVN